MRYINLLLVEDSNKQPLVLSLCTIYKLEYFAITHFWYLYAEI